ncbi:Ribonuclease H-like superfamily [Sesbania bispinosa]|nr:Ribonuclease H-like superfamily [Sesbania bispinosa]
MTLAKEAKSDVGVHWRAWSVLTKSKKDGGLGFKEFSSLNLAHLAKQAWRIINNPEALWVRILKSIYFPNNTFLQVKKKYGGSWIWSSLMEGRDFAKRNGQRLITNGRDIHLWEDTWLWSKETLQPYSIGGDLRVADILNVADHTWDQQFLSTNLPLAVAIKAKQTPIAWFQQKDKFYWPFSKDGLYTIKYGVASHWKRPLDGTLKINTDAAWSEANRGGAISVIVRDHKGVLLGGHAKRVFTYSPLVAEALAIREAAMLAYNLNFNKVSFESDNLPIIEACRGERRLAEVDFMAIKWRTMLLLSVLDSASL